MPASLLNRTADVMAPLLASRTSKYVIHHWRVSHQMQEKSCYSPAEEVWSTKRRSSQLQTNNEFVDFLESSRKSTNSACTRLERLALGRLRPHVLSLGNYCCSQVAYRTGYSTETALLKIVNDIRIAAGEGKCTILLALDISAAFDAVHHAVVFGKG